MSSAPIHTVPLAQRMTLSADVPINAQSQLTTPSGFLTDLSRVVE